MYEEEMEDVILENERENHWRIVLRTTREECITRNRFYMLRGGIYT